MGSYLLKKLGIGLLTIFALITISFFLTRLMPGNPFQSENVSPVVMDAMEKEYGLNDPLSVQYGTYLFNLFHGDLGVSMKKQGVYVSDIIGKAFGATFSIGILALVLSIVTGVGLGMWTARSNGRIAKQIQLLFSVCGIGIPNFVVALLLSLLFGVTLKWLPVAGLQGASYYVLPVISLAVYPAAAISDFVSQICKEELEKDYVLLARNKGLSTVQIMWKHVMRNAWIPVLNFLGPITAFLLTGSFAVESIFTIPGLGREFVNSIGNRDYTLIMGLTIFMGVVVVVVQMLIDLLCACLNPLTTQN